MSRRDSRKNKALTEDGRKNLPAEARQFLANASNDITIPYFSGSLQHVDDTLIQRGGGKGLKIYDEIERDTHAFAMLQKRKKTLLAREWEVKAASDDALDVEAAEVVREILTALPFDRICEDLLDATLKGFAVSEVVWGRDENRIIPTDIVSHDQRRFAFDQDWRPRLLTMANMRDGIELPDRKFIVHRHGVKGNNPYGLGLGTRLFWPVLFKRESVTFWLHFLEKYAGPTVVGTTPYGTLSDEQRRFLNTLSTIRTSSAVALPIGSDVKFLEAARSGAVTYQDFLAYWDKQISICTTGETLTTDIGNSGSRAASETHAEMLQLLVDSDGDLLSDTLREQLVTWIVEYNVPGAAVPSVWRVRPQNEKAAAEVRSAKAAAAAASNTALTAILVTAAKIEDDDLAREFITGFGLIDNLSDEAIDAVVEARFGSSDAGGDVGDIRNALQTNPAFAERLKKKHHNHDGHVCFAEAGGPVARITDQLIDRTAKHFARRLEAIRAALTVADVNAASRNILELAAIWTPDAFAAQIRDALELAAWEGREAVFQDGEDDPSFAAEAVDQSFREQIDFLKQKRLKPTKVWTDALRGDHDRAFVVAGVTDMAMLEEFHTAIISAVESGLSVTDFAKDFDRLVEKYGWSYRGERNWRIRTIFETNIRTSFMAGRLKQMRDPDVIRLRPYWQYRHADSRIPGFPRAQHVAWDRIVLMHDDPWWDIHFPPNDWRCSCGVRTLSRGDLRRLGKDGPDPTPRKAMDPIIDKVSGLLVEKPRGVGYGWDYQPGNLWEKGLVPSALLDEAGGLTVGSRHLAQIDTPEPMADLLAKAKPFTAKPLAEGLTDEDYVKGFLEPFGAEIGKAVLFEDKAGTRIPISDQLFRERSGVLKVGKRDRAMLTPLLAEALMDPDEIWIGVSAKKDPVNPDVEQLLIDRRYIRTDARTGLMIVFEIGQKFWDAITGYNTTDRKGQPDLILLDKRRGGKLLWKRK